MCSDEPVSDKHVFCVNAENLWPSKMKNLQIAGSYITSMLLVLVLAIWFNISVINQPFLIFRENI